MAPDFYRALESVSIASALSTALTIYPSPMPDPSPSTLRVSNSNFLQLGRRSSGRSQRTVYPRRLPVNCETHCFSGDRTHNLPIVSPLCYRDHLQKNKLKTPHLRCITSSQSPSSLSPTVTPSTFHSRLKVICFTNPFLHVFSSSIWAAFTDLALGPN